MDHIQSKLQVAELGNSTTAVGIAYVYCDYNAQIEQTALQLIASITKQLVEQKLLLIRRVKDLQERRKGGPPTWKDCTELLASIVRQFDKAIVVVDALDECTEVGDRQFQNREEFVKELLGLPLKLFITSRHLETIGGLLQSATKLEIRPDPGDIRSYLNSRIQDSTKLKAYIKKDSELKNDIINTVVTKYSEVYVINIFP